jgi:sarcosine oxidase, subunit beta
MSGKQYAADVVIVGGGIVGAASAFFLRKRGLSVILLERGLVGQQASGVNFGNARRQGRYLPQLPLAHRSRDIWGRLPELIDHDAEFIVTGHVRVVYDQAGMAAIETYATNARPWGLDLQILGKAEVHRRFPFLGPDVIGGSYSPNDGHANPRLAAPAFGRAARKAGATILENCEVLDMHKDALDFHVTAKDGTRVTAPVALVCAGAWAGRFSAEFGEPVPLVQRGPTMGVTEPLPYGIVPVVGVSSANPADDMYFRQVKRGNIVFGGSVRNEAFLDERRAQPKPGNSLLQLPHLRRIAPALANVHVLRTWSGVESYFPDDLPVMGPSQSVSGLYYAFGFCGHGFQTGPGVGDVMAELIDRGTTAIDLTHYSIRRFGTTPVAPQAHFATV